MTDHDRALGAALRELPVPEHAPGFWEALEQQLDGGAVQLTLPRRERAGRPRAVWLLSLAAAVALVVAAVAVLGGGRDGRDGTRVRIPATTAPPDPSVPPPDGPPAPPDEQPSWAPMAPSPLAPRSGHAAVWTGRVVLVWGGSGPEQVGYADGAAYDPAADRWTAMPAAPIPALTQPVAVWTGERMLVWGMVAGTFEPIRMAGASYDPATGTWVRMADFPRTGRGGATAVWTGERMVVWGGSGDGERWFGDGAAYDPDQDRWTVLPAAPIEPRDSHTAVWTGREMVVWGGNGGEETAELVFADGAAYDPSRGTWRVLPPAPLAKRWGHVAVWTGSTMSVWGGLGLGPDLTADGADYDPATGTWRRMPGADLTERFGATAVAAAGRMILYGGSPTGPGLAVEPHGAVYDPATGRWIPVDGPLQPRSGHAAVWTGAEMVVWGGRTGSPAELPAFAADGARFTPR